MFGGIMKKDGKAGTPPWKRRSAIKKQDMYVRDEKKLHQTS
jgi:hypothetical protein